MAMNRSPLTKAVHDGETIDWPAMFRYRDALARALRRQQGHRYPLQEYFSAGNLGMAEGFMTFKRGEGSSLRRHMQFRMKFHMLNVRIHEAGHGNIPDRNKGQALARYKIVRSSDTRMFEQRLARLHPVIGHRGYLRTYLHELFTYLESICESQDLGIFTSWLMEESWSSISKQYGFPINTTTVRIHRLRQRLRLYDLCENL